MITEALVLGIAQGVTEWLPISSDGVIVLISTQVFHSPLALGELIRYALFLHIGTALAAIVHFRRELITLARDLWEGRRRGVIHFYILATVVSGISGFLVLSVLDASSFFFASHGALLTLFVGLLLLATALAHYVKSYKAGKGEEALTLRDALVQGIAQGLSVLPGLSRSGLTVALFLLRGFKEETALIVSFIMSIPVVIGGNIILNANSFSFAPEMLIAVAASFAFGLMTIRALIALARTVNFAVFQLAFGALVILSALLS